MKKIEYITPDMEVIKLSVQRTVLQTVSGEGSGSTLDDDDIQTGGTGRP